MSDIGRHFASVLERSLVGNDDDCWPWTGGLCTKGYGQISRDGRHVLVHRVAYEAARGPIPPGAVIDHTCHDPAVCPGGKCSHRLCVNPAHLTATTNSENLRRQSPAAKTHCVNGHELAGANLGRSPSTGRRFCVTCNHAQSRAWRGKWFSVPSSEVRAWAVMRGLAKPGKGALSRAAVSAWDAAHPTRPYIVLPTPPTQALRKAS